MASGEPAACTSDVSRVLDALAAGDRKALGALFPLVYDELSRLAHRQRQQWDGDLTLNTTALVHEAYLKLAGQQRAGEGGKRSHRGLRSARRFTAATPGCGRHG